MARTTDQVTKVCTKSGESFTGTIEDLAEFFYRDKSQKDGLSPWCKAAERAYNKAYYAGLKKAKAPKKRAIATKRNLNVFEATMLPERVARGKAAKVAATKATRTAKGKARATATRKAKATVKGDIA
jgi:hypothetical protein